MTAKSMVGMSHYTLYQRHIVTSLQARHSQSMEKLPLEQTRISQQVTRVLLVKSGGGDRKGQWGLDSNVALPEHSNNR